MPTLTFQVATGTDDAYSRPTAPGSSSYLYVDAAIRNTLGDHALVEPEIEGLRFTNVTVPNGATIVNATLQLCYVSGAGGPVTTRWYGHNVDNSATFSSSTNTLTGSPRRRSPLTPSSDVSTLDWSAFTPGVFVNAADVTQAVSVVLQRPGWVSGNALVLIGFNEGTPDGNHVYYSTYDDSPGVAAKLVIEYFIPSTPTTPPTDWSALGKEDEKVYLYHVSKADGTFIGVLPDVSDVPRFTQALNSPGTTMTIQLSRSPNNKIEDRGYLLTAAGDRVTTEAGEPIVMVTQTPNNVGPGTDVDLNYNVDVYVVYGQFERLLADSGEYITTEAGDYIIVGTGAPLGRRIFSGFILDYETEYGSKNGVTITVASHGYELAKQLALSGSNTTFTYSTTELGAMIKTILDTNPGKITYDSSSIANTATSRTLKFVVNTKLESIESIYEQTPSGWYWFADVESNLLYLQQVSSQADHTFIIGRDIESLKVKQTIEALVNDVYFIGGEVTPGTPSTTLFKHYTEATSLTAYPRRGLKRITDRRYTSATNAQARADKDFSRYKNPIFTSPLIISASRYDIETIKLGQTVQFRGFGNFIDSLAPIQIVRRGYSPTEVVLELGELQGRQSNIVEGLREDLANEANIDLPTAPS